MNRVDYKLLHDKVEQQILQYLADIPSWSHSLGGYKHSTGICVYNTAHGPVMRNAPEGFEITSAVKLAIRELFREINTDRSAKAFNDFLRKSP
jgi:hypothetical protein